MSCSRNAAPPKRSPARPPLRQWAAKPSSAKKLSACSKSGPEGTNGMSAIALAIEDAPPSLRVRLEINLLHYVGHHRRLALGDLVDIIHALDHLAPHRVLAVEAGAAAVVEAD